jgi:hypothetical protein
VPSGTCCGKPSPFDWTNREVTASVEDIPPTSLKVVFCQVMMPNPLFDGSAHLPPPGCMLTSTYLRLSQSQRQRHLAALGPLFPLAERIRLIDSNFARRGPKVCER